jgi:hypothetical protein
MLGRHLKVVMIVHNRVRMNVHSFFSRSMSNNPEEDFVVVGIIEDLHAIDSPMHNVDTEALDIDATGTRHAGIPSKRRSNGLRSKMKAFWRMGAETSQNPQCRVSAVMARTAKQPEVSDPVSDTVSDPLYRASSTGSVTNDGSDADRKTLCVALRYSLSLAW